MPDFLNPLRDHIYSLFGVVVVFFLCLVLRRFGEKNGALLPPGPPKLPLLGNALDFPSSFGWETFHRWSKEYNSDILSLSFAGTSIIVLNSVKAAKDLLEKRSSIYSSRPKSTLITKTMGFSWAIPFMPYGTALKERRRLLQRHFHSSNDAIHKPLELQYSRSLLLQLRETPEAYMDHVRHAVGASLYSLTYGFKVAPSGDPKVGLAEKIGEYLADSAKMMAMLLDKMPFLIPILSPLLSIPAFKKSKAEWDAVTTLLRDVPFYDVQKSMADGIAEPSFVSKSLEALSTSDDQEKQQIIKDAAAIVFTGGFGSTIAVLHTFFLAMTLFPDVQAKAHEEIDRVMGCDRLPDFDDEQNLPYLGALLKEVHRWKPSAPFGIPHLLEKDDEYNGYYIPGQSIVIANVWAMLHNEEDYPEASAFKPERFLKNGLPDPSVRDLTSVAFGIGRRSCPGMHIAQSILWVIMASILSVFEISAPVDGRGVKIMPSGEYHSGLTLFQPVSFKCTIKPRHSMSESLIRSGASHQETVH